MKQNFLFAYLLIFLATINLTFSSCTKPKSNNEPIQSSWLIPLLKGKIDVDDLSTLVNKYYSFKIHPEDFNIDSSSPVSHPTPQTFTNLGTYTIETNDLIHRIYIAEGQVRVIITNHFPVSIKAGSKFHLSSPGISSGTLASFNLNQDIGPGVSDTSYISLSNLTIGNEIQATVVQLVIDGYDNITFNGSLEFELLFENIAIQSLDLITDKNWVLTDTVEFDVSDLNLGENLENINDSLVHATIHFKGENELPANSRFQVYFANDNYQVIDSLFSTGGKVNGAIYTGNQFSEATKNQFPTELSKQRLEKLKSASHAFYYLQLDTYGYNNNILKVKNQQKFDLKISGDIRLLISPNFFKSL